MADALGIANCSHGHTWNCPQPKTDSVKEHQIRENFKGALTCQFPQARPSSPFPLTSTTATPRQFSNWSINLHEIGYECIRFFRFGSQLNQSGKTIWDPFTMSEVLIRTDDLLLYELENLHHQWQQPLVLSDMLNARKVLTHMQKHTPHSIHSHHLCWWRESLVLPTTGHQTWSGPGWWQTPETAAKGLTPTAESLCQDLQVTTQLCT